MIRLETAFANARLLGNADLDFVLDEFVRLRVEKNELVADRDRLLEILRQIREEPECAPAIHEIATEALAVLSRRPT